MQNPTTSKQELKPIMQKGELLDTIYELIASVRSNGAYPAETFIADIVEKLIESGKQEERDKVVNEQLVITIREDGTRLFNGIPDYEYLKIDALKRIAEAIEALKDSV